MMSHFWLGDFEKSSFETIREVSSLKYQVEQKDEEINYLKKEISTVYSRKIKTQDEINISKTKKKNNMELK